MKKALFALMALTFLPGCPVNLNRVPGDTDRLKDTQTSYNYYLYVPSWHSNEQSWPVVVTCHGTHPYDSAWSQIHEWRAIAEQYGLLIIAPELKAVHSSKTLDTKNQIARQKQDEEAILSITNKTISSLNGDPNRVYMVGWSAGGYDVYYTGLRNPQTFRALAVRMGNFDEKFVPDVKQQIDPYQPVAVFMASEDLPIINTQCRKAYNWLTQNGMKRASIQEVTGVHERKPKIAFDYFKNITKSYSFIRLNAIKDIDNNPLAVQFYSKVEPAPRAIVWDFADKTISNENNPKHVFPAPGLYDVKVTVITANSTRTERKILIRIDR